jgi:vacuolar-type H+-ATPase subunit E/Vma4
MGQNTVNSGINTKEPQISLSQTDRDRILYDIDKRLTRMEATLEQFMKATDKHFEDIRSDMNKRFEVHAQISEVRQELHTQISEVRQDMRNMMLLFGGLVASIIGFAL